MRRKGYGTAFLVKKSQKKQVRFVDKSHKSLRDLTYRSSPHKYDKKNEEEGIRTLEPTKGLDSS